MNEQQRILEAYLAEQITACRQRSGRLARDGRTDEGIFENIRANIYEIFKTILSAAERVSANDATAGRRYFLQKTEQIPAGWAASYEKARQEGDAKKMHVESIKLSTAREIRDMCMQLWEENP